MITLQWVYVIAGLAFIAYAWMNVRDAGHPHRWGNAAFWSLMALSMLAGDRLGDLGNGLLVIGLALLAGFGLVGRRPLAQTAAGDAPAGTARFSASLFLIALIIPATALLGTLLFKSMPALFDTAQVTLISLALGVLCALAAGYAHLRPRLLQPLEEGRRLMDSVGWAAVLPQMLASLGAVFAVAGVGDVVGGLVQLGIPEGSRLGAVIAFGLGMALFTMVMGNAFAAFPVMIAAIGMPLLIQGYGGDPAVVCAIGMLAGFCGTLLTPMAANFNLVPAALLELKNEHAVIHRQIGTALPLLGINIAFIYLFAFG